MFKKITRKIIRFFSLFGMNSIILLFILTACETGSMDEQGIPEARYIVPQTQGEQVQVALAVDRYSETREQPAPRIPLSNHDTLVQVIEINLNFDRYDEQILAVKDQRDADSPIRIIIAAYDPIRTTYHQAWQGETNATSVRAFNISLIDLVGNHGMEIVCTGIDNQGWQIIDVFHRSTIDGSGNLSFNTILSLSAQGTIEIEEHQRSQAYQSGQQSGDSFPVIVTVKDETSDGIVDFIKKSYFWTPQNHQYTKVKEEKVSGQEIESRQLRELLRGGESDFINFLKGPWKITAEIPGEDSAMIYFDPDDNSIILYTGSTQEVYIWENSYKLLSNSLLINGQNKLVPYIKNQLTVNIIDMHTIKITLYDVNSQNGRRTLSNQWSGNYFQLGDSARKALLRDVDNQRIDEMPRLSGYYISDVGDELFLDPPNFRLHKESNILSGGFALYSMGVPIFAKKIINQSGIVTEEQIYKFDFMEEQKGKEIVRTLFLIPGKIGVFGFQPLDQDFVRFEQVEVVDD